VPGLKLLFCTDLHASDAYLFKIISYAKSFKVDVLIISGDLTGKALVPIVRLPDGSYKAQLFGREERFGEEALPAMKQAIARAGYYARVCTQQDYQRMKEDERLRAEAFRSAMVERLEAQIAQLERELPPEVTVIMNPGNDDEFFVDDVLKRAERVKYTIGQVEELGDFRLISCEWVNPTPWNSPRECEEDELLKRLQAEFERAGSTERLLCDFHAPPFRTTLDLAPKLDRNLRPKRNLFGQPVFEHVGSKAVRKALEEYQPLLSLHGHIHESPGSYTLGRTTCLNPGSEYEEGIMHGYLVILGHNLDYKPVIGA